MIIIIKKINDGGKEHNNETWVTQVTDVTLTSYLALTTQAVPSVIQEPGMQFSENIYNSQ